MEVPLTLESSGLRERDDTTNVEMNGRLIPPGRADRIERIDHDSRDLQESGCARVENRFVDLSDSLGAEPIGESGLGRRRERRKRIGIEEQHPVILTDLEVSHHASTEEMAATALRSSSGRTGSTFVFWLSEKLARHMGCSRAWISRVLGPRVP